MVNKNSCGNLIIPVKNSIRSSITPIQKYFAFSPRNSIDLCANGHYLYGFITITCVALPGILFGVSDFLNFKGFSFGRVIENPFLRRWPMIIKLLVLPIYMILMVPLVIFITSYKYEIIDNFRVLERGWMHSPKKSLINFTFV